jgi:hypothetical protein
MDEPISKSAAICRQLPNVAPAEQAPADPADFYTLDRFTGHLGSQHARSIGFLQQRRQRARTCRNLAVSYWP